MNSKKSWIENLVVALQKSGCKVELKQDHWQVGKLRVVLISSGHKHEVMKSETIYLHEDIVRNRMSQVVNRLISQAGMNQRKIHGRSTKVFKIDLKSAKEFIDDNHVMGFGGGKYFYGLYLKTELVAVAAFSKIRWMKYENPPYWSTELERYCCLPQTSVNGGLSKLISFFELHHKSDDLITTSDLEWSDGKAYQKIGFEAIDKTSALLFAVNKKSFQRRLIKLETELLENEYAVSNLGNIKWRKNNDYSSPKTS
ncbi:MAG: hypothetical protein IPM74_10705 [Crocinitomicaceae bacterium]|nr:hypothetical protein [Crocinitomicaceae bacterium]MBK8926358.1 hypothetical protein [Crocinitomicaceae bacterium]